MATTTDRRGFIRRHGFRPHSPVRGVFPVVVTVLRDSVILRFKQHYKGGGAMSVGDARRLAATLNKAADAIEADRT